MVNNEEGRQTLIGNLMQNPTFARFGLLARTYCKTELPLSILKSNAGYYIGTHSEDGPVSRESMEYWRSKAAAEQALEKGEWTQKTEP